MRPTRRSTIVLTGCVLVSVLLAGCEDIQDFLATDKYRLFGPHHVVRPPERPGINPIRDTIGMGDTHQELVPNATFPREGDWSYSERDYVIGAEDVLDISVLDLFQQGLETVLRRQVSISGYIDLPRLPERVKAEGLTAAELKEAVKDAYREDMLRDPTVSISIVSKRQNTFSVLGPVDRPGTYNIIRKDMRLLEALATAGGITQTNIPYIYVIRPTPAVAKTAAPGRGAEAELPKIPDAASDQPGDEPSETPSEEPADEPTDAETDAALQEIEGLLGGEGTTRPTPPEPDVPRQTHTPRFSETASTGPTTGPSGMPSPSRRVKWIYSDGRWIPVTEEAPPADEPSGRDSEPVRPAGRPAPHREALSPRTRQEGRDPFGWREIVRSDMARVIAINLKKLRAGDPRMNIVIHSNDIVHVPPLEVGEFYVGGEVRRPGVYSLTGRNVTVKQAVTAAGNLGVVSWPENSILIRRLGGIQEQMVSLNVEAIFQGDEPDLFLRPDDVIVVGTDPRATFYAVMRNAFRMTYGFGFIYDRNFANPLLTTPTSRRFSRL